MENGTDAVTRPTNGVNGPNSSVTLELDVGIMRVMPFRVKEDGRCVRVGRMTRYTARQGLRLFVVIERIDIAERR